MANLLKVCWMAWWSVFNSISVSLNKHGKNSPLKSAETQVSGAVTEFLLVWRSFQTPARIILTLMLNEKKTFYSPTFSIFCRLSWFKQSKQTCPPKPPPPALREGARGASWATCLWRAPDGTRPNATSCRHPNQMPKPPRLEAEWPQTDVK